MDGLSLTGLLDLLLGQDALPLIAVVLLVRGEIRTAQLLAALKTLSIAHTPADENPKTTLTNWS